MDTPITQFRGEYDFLSNFYRGTDLPLSLRISLEHHFQAAKTDNNGEKAQILMASTPAEAKQRGKRATLRLDWELVKNDVMLDLLRRKFAQNTKLAERLLATGNRPLIEGNAWHDNYWGSCSCAACKNQGENWLGKLLMQVRDELRALTVEMAKRTHKFCPLCGGKKVQKHEAWTTVHIEGGEYDDAAQVYDLDADAELFRCADCDSEFAIL